MLQFITPDLYVIDILSINPADLTNMGVKGVICDLDNTIIPWDKEILSGEVKDWFQRLKDADFRLCLVSNSLHNRVSQIAKTLDIDSIPAAIKPRKSGFKRAMDKLGLKQQEIVVIGDQVFTDVLGGKRMGFKTILVVPIAEKELFWTRFIRRIERRALQLMIRKGILSGIDKDKQ